MKCEEIFDKLTYETRTDLAAGKLAPSEFYRRYWGLQFNQFHYWKSGFITHEVYRAWMCFRRHEWQKNEELSGVTYRDGWTIAVESWGFNREFTTFMESVFRGEHPLVRCGD